MAPPRKAIKIFHIVHLERLESILRDQQLLSEATLLERHGGVAEDGIAYAHIKQRRMNEIVIDCCGGLTVGHFVPFYFCPRSPMLYTINRGNTGYPQGCQSQIVHLVSSFSLAIGLGNQWAFSDGNAGAFHANFYNQVKDLDEIDWGAIESNDWSGTRMHRKMAEFLIEDSFPTSAIQEIGCQTQDAVRSVRAMAHRVGGLNDDVLIGVKQSGRNPQAWYYS